MSIVEQPKLTLIIAECADELIDLDRNGRYSCGNQSNNVARLRDKGTLRHTVNEQIGPLSAENLRIAHAKVESGTMVGKLVLDGISLPGT